MTKINQIFKTGAKNPNEIHTPNIFQKTLNDTQKKGYYNEAIEALKPKTYLEENRPIYLFAKFFTTTFHIASFLLSLITVYIVVFVYGGVESTSLDIPVYALWIGAIITATLLIFLLIGAELFKSISAKKVFKAMAVSEKLPNGSMLSLILLVIINVAISAIGGGALSYKLGDKSKVIESTYTNHIDSVQALYKNKIASYQSEVNVINQQKANRLKKSKLWGLTNEENKILQHNKEQIARLESEQNNALGQLRSEQKQEMTISLTDNKNAAYITAVIVSILELLSVFCYKFIYTYYANCEKEAINFSVVEPVPNSMATTTPATNDINALVNALTNVLQNPNILQAAPITNAPTTYEPKRIGFTFGQNTATTPTQKEETHVSTTNVNNASHNVPNATKQPKKIGAIALCESCNGEYKVKTSWQRFCSDGCKLKWHEEHNGFTLAKLKRK